MCWRGMGDGKHAEGCAIGAALREHAPEALDARTTAKRSNCVLSVDKLRLAGVELPPAHALIRRYLSDSAWQTAIGGAA